MQNPINPIQFRLENIADVNGDGQLDHLIFQQVADNKFENIRYELTGNPATPGLIEVPTLPQVQFKIVGEGQQNLSPGLYVGLNADFDGDNAFDGVMVSFENEIPMRHSYLSSSVGKNDLENSATDAEAQARVSQQMIANVATASAQKMTSAFTSDGIEIRTISFPKPATQPTQTDVSEFEPARIKRDAEDESVIYVLDDVIDADGNGSLDDVKLMRDESGNYDTMITLYTENTYNSTLNMKARVNQISYINPSLTIRGHYDADDQIDTVSINLQDDNFWMVKHTTEDNTKTFYKGSIDHERSAKHIVFEEKE